jgi:hypothetical protein
MPTPTESVRAYTAGYLDGEGCIRWNNCTPNVTLESCNPNPMQFVAAHYGGKVTQVKRKTPTTKRPVYRLSYYGPTAITLLLSLLEFLIEKKDQAENLICMWEANMAIRNDRRKKH